MNRKFNFLILLLFVPFIAILLFFSLFKMRQGPSNIIIRFDDYGILCNDEWISIEEKIIKLHKDYNIKITFGVIPNSRYILTRHPYSPPSYPNKDVISNAKLISLINEKRINTLKSIVHKGLAEGALHGYFHPVGYSNIEHNTEFYNVSYDEQYKKLSYGKLMLDSLFRTQVRTFIPPHNTYDRLTLDLCYELGFKCISAKVNSFDSPIDCKIPISCLWQTFVDVDEFLEFLKEKHFCKEPVQVLALHHTNFTTDGKLDESKISQYEKLLSFISQNSIPNHTLSGYQNCLNTTHDLYNRYAFQNIVSKINTNFASKFYNLCTRFGFLSVIFSLHFALALLYSGILLILLSLVRLKYYKIVEIIFRWLSLITLLCSVLYLFSKYCISPHNLYYSILSYRMFIICFFISTSVTMWLYIKTKNYYR